MLKLVLALTVAFSAISVNAWGGLFNRFNPSIISDLGYGGQGGSYGRELYRVAESRPAAEMNNLAAVLEAEAEEEAADPCNGKPCTANEHCCEGHACVDTEDGLTGVCMPFYGRKQGEQCFRDNDCEPGFMCVATGRGRECQTPIPGDKGLGEHCRMSSDCNINKGLCCQLHRRAKSQPKKICAYFSDPMMCVGPVATNQILTAVEHTAGEKRLSGHPDDFLRVKK